MALNFHLFNCDRTFSLDKVEALIQRVAEKLSRETKIEKTNFDLPHMKQLCEKLEKEDSHFDYAVFVVHAHESRLWINTDGRGYSKLYRTLQRVTGDRVLIVIGGDDNYKDQEERDMSVLSRWASNKMRSQFTEDYVNGMKGFIFSWEENHNPIHEEALEFYLPKKFVPKQLPAKVPEKEETKNIEQAKLQLEVKKQEPQPVEKKESLQEELSPKRNENRALPSRPSLEKELPSHGSLLSERKKEEPRPIEEKESLEKELPSHGPLLSERKKEEPRPIEEKESLEKELSPKRNESRAQPSRPETSTEDMTDPVQKENQISAISGKSEDVSIKRGFYRASISYGRVVQVLMSDPPGWEPDTRNLNDLVMKHGSVKKAIIEFWDEGDGRGLQSIIHPSEAKLYKIAEGLGTDKMHSILVYSYHVEEETNEMITNFMKYLNVHEPSPCQPVNPTSLMHEIKGTNPDYVMFSVDADVLENPDEVKKLVREHRTKFKDIIENCVGQGVIIMLFGDKSYKNRGEFASKEATQYVRMLAQDIVEPDRLTVITCQNRPYITHQEWMEKILKSKGTKSFTPQQLASQRAVPSVPCKQHYYKAVIRSGQIIEVLECIPPGWKPDEGIMVRKRLHENEKVKQGYLEISGNEQGEILSIVVEKESKVAYLAKKLDPTSWFSGNDSQDKDKNPSGEHYV